MAQFAWLKWDIFVFDFITKKIVSMKKYDVERMRVTSGGSDKCGTIKSIGIISCIGAAIWPIGTLISGPTCAGMLIAAYDRCN
jgi:hypothetical protein